MRLTYDPRYNVAYICLKEKTAQIETVRITDDLNIDLAPDGTVYGIELLNANEQLAAFPKGKLVLVNEAVGKAAEIDLPT
jgi:uncharacterized protein YuzE